jgi:IS605 OrfB family transposase
MQSLKQWNMATFNGPVLPITWMRDFHRNKTGSRILGELITLHHPNIPESGWKCSNIKRYGKVWYLLLCYEIEIPELKKTGGIVGVDIGLKRMMVATNSSNSKTLFFHGGKLNHLRTGIRKTRAQVQAVGTRSARRLLKRMSGHEAAVTEHLLHVASKALITYAVSNDCRKIVLEDLSNIRDASLNKGKDLRSKVQRWPYANLQFKITYKALAQGIETELVNPKNTSRGCARCGHVAPSNRKGLNFKCKKCGHRQDADRNASENIRLRSVSREHDSRLMGSYNPPKNSEPLEIRTKSPVSDADLVGV